MPHRIKTLVRRTVAGRRAELGHLRRFLLMPPRVISLQRRNLLALTIGGLLLPVVSFASVPSDQSAVLHNIETYLNGLTCISAQFLQVAPDGSTRTGKAWLQRPGKMRFEYDPPDPQLLVAGFGLLVYHDPDVNQTSNIPLSSTPLGILLAKNVVLSGSVTVTKIETPPGEIQVSLIRTGKAPEGTLTLVFSTDPIELRQWRVIDAQGQQTRVSLYNIKTIAPLPDTMFEYVPGFTSHSG